MSEKQTFLAELVERDLRAVWHDGGVDTCPYDIGRHQPQAWTIVLIAQSDKSCEIRHEHQGYALAAGEGIVIPEFTPFSVHSSAPTAWAAVRWRLAGTIDFSQTIAFQALVSESAQQLRHSIREFTDSCHQHDPVFRAVDSLYKNIGFLREVLGGLRDLDPLGRSVGQLDRLRPVLNYMHAHLSRPIYRAELARLVDLSEGRFHDVFRQCFRAAPLLYLKRLRMAQAQRLLLLNSHSISEIARQVGYNDPFHFSRAFKKVVGCSPRAFRQSQQTSEPPLT